MPKILFGCQQHLIFEILVDEPSPICLTFEILAERE